MLRDHFHSEAVDRLLFSCVRTVSEPHLFQPWNLLVERKQLPRFAGNVNS
jgi:hypothetical protein